MHSAKAKWLILSYLVKEMRNEMDEPCGTICTECSLFNATIGCRDRREQIQSALNTLDAEISGALESYYGDEANPVLKMIEL